MGRRTSGEGQVNFGALDAEGRWLEADCGEFEKFMWECRRLGNRIAEMLKKRSGVAEFLSREARLQRRSSP